VFKEDNEFNHENLGFHTSEEEVKLELAVEKNGKAARPGGVHSEILKYENKIITLLTKLYRKIIQGGQILEQMMLEYVTSAYKKGDERSCSNFRGICVTNPTMKTYGTLIKHRLEEKYVNLEEQCSFMTRRSRIYIASLR
jgi:hypothetical protein